MRLPTAAAPQNPSRTARRRRADAPAVTPPFPFVGAGEARYFEWADLYVRFRTAPTPAQRRKIAAGVPAPLDDLEWDDAVLYASSEQAVGRQISAAYGPKAKLPAKLTNLNRFQAAARDKVARFNAHTEAWLEEVHAICPILIAFRRQDHEAGGTKLSAWHKASLPAIAPALDAMAKAPCARDLDLARRVIAEAKAARAKVDPALLKKLERVCKPLLAARGDDDDETADGLAAMIGANEAARAAMLAAKEAALATPKGYDPKKLKTADPDGMARALAALERVLPKLVTALREAKNVELRPGADKAAIAACEKALDKRLRPPHRALVAAFDGGTVGELVFLGTPASGAKGRDSIVAFAKAIDDRALTPVLRHGESFIACTWDAALQTVKRKGGGYKHSDRPTDLDTLLAVAVKAGKLA